MAPSLITEDYYQVLEISQAADAATIKASYKRLARLRHPDKRPNDPAATAQFQLLQAAYATLIDTREREKYDTYYARIRSSRPTASGNGDSSPFQDRRTAGSTPQTRAQTQPPADGEESQQGKKQTEDFGKILESLMRRQRSLGTEILQAEQAMNRVQEALDRLQQEEDKDAQEDVTRNGWFSFVFGRRESPEEKEVRERRATERRTGRIVREAEFRTRKTKFGELNAQMRDLNIKIATAQYNKTTETRREERRQQERQEAERLRQKTEARRKMQENLRRAEEEQARKVREEEKRRQERNEKLRQEEARKEREEEKRREEWRETLRQWEARKELEEERRRQERKEKLQQETKGTQRVPHGTCQHKGWWSRVEKRSRCEHCLRWTTRFAFQCPSCSMTACAACRDILKKGR